MDNAEFEKMADFLLRIKELEDKVSRRNLQIKNLKKRNDQLSNAFEDLANLHPEDAEQVRLNNSL